MPPLQGLGRFGCGCPQRVLTEHGLCRTATPGVPLYFPFNTSTGTDTAGCVYAAPPIVAEQVRLNVADAAAAVGAACTSIAKSLAAPGTGLGGATRVAPAGRPSSFNCTGSLKTGWRRSRPLS